MRLHDHAPVVQPTTCRQCIYADYHLHMTCTRGCQPAVCRTQPCKWGCGRQGREGGWRKGRVSHAKNAVHRSMTSVCCPCTLVAQWCRGKKHQLPTGCTLAVHNSSPRPDKTPSNIRAALQCCRHLSTTLLYSVSLLLLGEDTHGMAYS